MLLGCFGDGGGGGLTYEKLRDARHNLIERWCMD